MQYVQQPNQAQVEENKVKESGQWCQKPKKCDWFDHFYVSSGFFPAPSYRG